MPIQKWFFELHTPHPGFFNVVRLLQLNENVDCERLGKSLQQLIRHHDALRMNFSKENGTWMQINRSNREVEFQLEHISLENFDPEEQQREKHDSIFQIQNSIDLENGLLIKAVVFELGTAGRQLFIAIHHLISDIVSMKIFLEDLKDIYRTFASGSGSWQKSKSTSYLEWSNRLYTEIKPGDIDIGYWQGLEPDRVDRLTSRKVTDIALKNIVISNPILDKRHTQALKLSALEKYDATLEELLLSALVLCLQDLENFHHILKYN